MADTRVGMAFFGFLAMMFVLCISVYGVGAKNTSPPPSAKATTGNATGKPSTTASTTVASTPTTANHSESTTTKPGNHSSSTTAKPGNHSTPTPTKSGNHSTPTPTKPGKHSTPTPTKPGNQSTSATHENHPPTPKGHGKDNGGSGSSRGKWVATAFAILFGITTIVMTVLYCRQRKIYRELEGDSSLSRLI